MEYRRLGRTEKQVSLLGVGGGYVMLLDIEHATQVYQRAAELGVNYFDGRYGYSSTMQRPVIRQDRAHFIVGSKTASTTHEDVLRRVDEDLKELDSGYLDIYYLRAYNQEMINTHFAPGGSVEGLLEAKQQGKIHALGLAGHSDLTALARGVETGLIDVVEFPLNIVRREAFDILIPACQKHDVGMVIMKPMNVGLAPAEVCLPWLANQPIHVMAPGISNLEHLELDVKVLERQPMTLTPAEEAEVERWRDQVDLETCRICDRVCQVVCEQYLKIDWLLYHDVFQNELRRLGPQGFVEYPFAPWVKEQAEVTFANTVAELQACTHCRKCEEVCPHHLPVMDLLEEIKEQQIELLEEIKSAGWASKYKDSETPLSKKALSSWISGGKKRGTNHVH
jgi:predicted aldo/keto reductase-like oxidoreductase